MRTANCSSLVLLIGVLLISVFEISSSLSLEENFQEYIERFEKPYEHNSTEYYKRLRIFKVSGIARALPTN